MNPLDAALQELLMALAVMNAACEMAQEAAARLEALAAIEKAKEEN